MLDYLSDYRTQDKMGGVHYYPSGALCWFECNQYGDPTGTLYYARKIPDMKQLEIPRRQRGLKRLLKAQSRKLSMQERIASELPDNEIWPFKPPRYKK